MQVIKEEFNLLEEPWILAMNHKGIVEELSLTDVFRRAHEFQELAGELPTQDMAVLRLLLAVLHSVFGRYDVCGKNSSISALAGASPADAKRRWKTLWDKGEFPKEVIEKYLLKFKDRFWLFHSDNPFYQMAALADRNEKDFFGPFDVSKLNGVLLEGDNKSRLFPQLTGKHKKSLTYAEAARWLLHCNAFAETFGKLEAKNKSKNALTLGVGWLGKLGLIAAAGNNLFETLMLNLVLLPNGGKTLWGDEVPIWEIDGADNSERVEIIIPNNPSELLTLQSRRILLEREDGKVTKYRFVSGAFFAKENALNEQMTVWKNAAKKETDPPVYEPKRHLPSKRIWRDFSSIAAHGKKRPGVVEWLSVLKNEKLVSCSYFRFMTASVSYGTMQAMVDDVFLDSISFNAGLLTDLGAAWVDRIIREIETTDLLVSQIWFMARDLTIAGGGADGEGYGNMAREQAYHMLDIPFCQWLERIHPEDETDDVCEEWFVTARELIRRLGRELVAKCSPQAFTGRQAKVREKMRLYTASGVYNNFLSNTKDRAALEKSNRKGARA